MKHQLSMFFACLTLMTFSAAVTMADLTEGLLAYWPLNEKSGRTAHDASGNGHDGTLENDPIWTTDSRMGTGALAFDGTDDRVIVDSFDVVDGSGITLAAWIKPNSFNSDDARVISKAEGGGTPEHYWALVMSGNGEDDLQFRLRTDAGAASKITVPDGQEVEAGVWTHVAVTWDVSDPNMRFYKNGEEIHSTGKAGAVVGTGPDVKVGIGNQSISAGADSMDRPFDGAIDDVSIWNRALTVDEINELMANGLPSAVEPDGKLTVTWGAVKQ